MVPRHGPPTFASTVSAQQRRCKKRVNSACAKSSLNQAQATNPFYILLLQLCVFVCEPFVRCCLQKMKKQKQDEAELPKKLNFTSFRCVYAL